jgi:hypothetical protein
MLQEKIAFGETCGAWPGHLWENFFSLWPIPGFASGATARRGSLPALRPCPVSLILDLP